MYNQSFEIENLSDECVSIGSTTHNLPVLQMANDWFVAYDASSPERLKMVKLDAGTTPLTAVFRRADQSTYNRTADFWGWRP